MTHCYTMWSVEFTASQRGEEKAAGKRLTAQQQLQTLQSSIFYRLKGKLHLVIKKPTKTAKDRDKIKIDLQIKKYHPTGRTSYYSNTPVSFYLYFDNSPVNSLPLFVQLYCPYS